jgi:hypothetical protein
MRLARAERLDSQRKITEHRFVSHAFPFHRGEAHRRSANILSQFIKIAAQFVPYAPLSPQCLDLLGFVRPNRDFSRACGQSKLNFFLLRRLGRARRRVAFGFGRFVRDDPQFAEVFARRRAHDLVHVEIDGDAVDPRAASCAPRRHRPGWRRRRSGSGRTGRAP